MTSQETPGELERKALELLPWYVNGTLAADEREFVGRQVRASLGCRKEFERLRRLQSLIQRDDAEAVASDREFERLMARIRASDAAARKVPAAGARYRRWMRFALAATLAAVVSAPLWWSNPTPSGSSGDYETMTDPQDADATTGRLRVLFAPGVTGTEQRELLARHGLAASGPPATDGTVAIALPEGADRAAIVAALKRDPRVRLVTTPPASGEP